ncbi:hypothetical protein [Faecalibacterium sp. 9]
MIVSTKTPPIFLVQNFSNDLKSLLWRYKDWRIFGVKRDQNRLVMHHAIAVGKELCLGFVWGMFIVFFQISTVIIYEYTDIPAFKFFAALHPYNLSVMIRVEPFARPRSYCCRYDEQLAAEKQRTERVTKRILTKEEMSSSVPLSTMPAVRSQKNWKR